MKQYRIVSLERIFHRSPGGWEIYTLAYNDDEGKERTLYGDAIQNVQIVNDPVLKATLRNEIQDIIKLIKTLAINPTLNLPDLRNETLKKFKGEFVLHAFPNLRQSGQFRLYCFIIEEQKSLILFGGGRKHSAIAQNSPQTKPAIELANKLAYKINKHLKTCSLNEILGKPL